MFRRDRSTGSHVGHRSDEHGRAEYGRNPEATLHVHALGIRAVVERNDARLERHAAQRAGARPDLDHVGVHRAGVLSAWGRRRRLGPWTEKLRRVISESLDAAFVTEEVANVLMNERPDSVFLLDGHPAHGIDVAHPSSVYRELHRALQWPHRFRQLC